MLNSFLEWLWQAENLPPILLAITYIVLVFWAKKGIEEYDKWH